MSTTMALADTARPPAAPDASSAYGRYRLVSRIGVGGMAEVFRATVRGPEGWERELVVKRILPQLSGNAEFTRMFIREAKISALLMHPSIVQIYEFGEAEGSYFIAMECVQGVTVREALTKLKQAQRSMPFMVAAEIARQACTGLDYAHTLHGADGRPLEIVHQDISPTNIMLAYNGTVKILDFGIARAASFAEEESKSKLIKGKIAYLAPEQVKLDPFDARADIFALGAVMHEMLTGTRLFQAKNDILRMKQLLAQPIPPPSSVNAAIPRELDRIVMKALELDPDQRYPSAAVMAADLERTLIAARYSSRDLSKLLHGLFVPPGEPLVVVDGTTAATGADPPRTPSAPPAPTDRMRPVRAGPGGRLGGALRAERARLVWERWRTRGKMALGAVAVGVAVGMAALAVRQYGPALLGTEAPAPAAAAAAEKPPRAAPAAPAAPIAAPAAAPRKRPALRRPKPASDPAASAGAEPDEHAAPGEPAAPSAAAVPAEAPAPSTPSTPSAPPPITE
jgi:eukaryotic-like serine/threonine-protein kinase